MTDISVEAVPEAPVETTPPPPVPPATAPQPELVAHTPGGYPVAPLALSGANTTVGLVGAAGLAGGPVGAAAAVGGAALVGTVAAIVRARRSIKQSERAAARKASTPRGTGSRSGSRSGSGSGARRPGQGGRGGRGLPRQSRGSRASSLTGRGSSSGAGAGRGWGKRKASAVRGGSRNGRGGWSGAGRSVAGRIGQARALRAANARQNPTRSAARTNGTQARRAVADARRDAKAAARQAQTTSRGRVGRAAGWAGGKAASGARALVNRGRAQRDRRQDRAVADKRSGIRKAPARRAARWALWASAARLFGRRLLAGFLGGVVGLVGCVTTPLGRWLGVDWLMYPGRRLYRRLMGTARKARAERDARIRQALREQEAAADALDDTGLDAIGDRIERPAHLVPSPYSPIQEVVNVSGFKFEEAAAEMQNAAATYDPDDNMEVVDMIDNLPAALECVAKTFLILAERSDQEFAFEKPVADGFADIYQSLLNAVDAAVDLGPMFREVHAADIARHEDPRNGTDAEKKWNV